LISKFNDLIIPSYTIYREITPPPEFLSSSSVEATPPKIIKRRLKNYAKYTNIPGITPKYQRNLNRIFQHTKIDAERTNITSETIARMADVRTPLQRKKSKQ
jgi:hypothetical protein